MSDPEPADEDLLRRYRAAVARGSEDEIRSLAQTLMQRRDAFSSPERKAGRSIRMPSVMGRARRLNQRYNPVGLAYFDEIASRYRDGLKDRRGKGAQRLEAEMLRAHRRLLRPIPLVRLAVPPIVVALLVAATLVFRPRPEDKVVVLSPGGDVEVELTPNRPDLDSRVTEQGTVWTLPAGKYVVRANGLESAFRVPLDRVVLLPGREKDYHDSLQRVLDLEDAHGPDR